MVMVFQDIYDAPPYEQAGKGGALLP